MISTSDRMTFLGALKPRCLRLISGVSLRPEFPLLTIDTIKNSFAVPGQFCLYDENGLAIPSTRLITLENATTVTDRHRSAINLQNSRFGVERIDLAKLKNRFPTVFFDRTVQYLGLWSAHYGHFLMDYTARSWPAPGDTAFVSSYPDSSILNLPYVRPFANEYATLLHQPVDQIYNFREVAIAQQSVQAGVSISSLADLAHLRLSAASTQTRDYRNPVYLSRAKLDVRLRDSFKEDQAERIFEKRGFEVLYPEQLSVGDQMAVFNEAPIIAGIAGSAMHSAMFARKDVKNRLIFLTDEKLLTLNGRHLLTSLIKSYSSSYVAACDILDDGSRRPNVAVNSDRLQSLLRDVPI